MHAGIHLAYAGPEENGDLIRGRAASAINLIAEVGPTELRWLQRGLDAIAIARDPNWRKTILIPECGVLIINPATVYRQSDGVLAMRLVYQAALLRFWRAGFSEIGPSRFRLEYLAAIHALAFGRRVASLSAEELAPYTEYVARMKSWSQKAMGHVRVGAV